MAVIPFLSTHAIKRQSGGEATFVRLFLHAFGVVFIFNLVDLILLDWLMFCTITPKSVVIPGTEGAQAYKDYFFHFKASIIGTILSILGGLLIAGCVSLL